MQFKNALSIDVEDWFQGVLAIKYSEWENYPSRLETCLFRILDILRSYSVKATFFVLGYTAERHPDIIRQIAREGHEIACHGYAHRLIYTQSKEEFRRDTLMAKEAIEKIAETKVKGFRAPFFSITSKSIWALDILAELGFSYDSSVFPVKNFLYGIPDAPHTIYAIGTNGLVEFPLSVVKVAGFKLPICGGFYLRSLPYIVTKYGIKHFNQKGYPVVIYMHPWEIDIEKPKVSMRLKWKIIHEYNIGKMQKKFESLIKDFSFTTISEVLNGAR